MAIHVFQEILQMNVFSAFVTEWRWEKKEMSINYPVTQRLADFLNSECNQTTSLKFEANDQIIHGRATEMLLDVGTGNLQYHSIGLNGLCMCVCLCVLVDLWQAVWRLCVVEQKAQTVSCNHQYMTVKSAVSGNSSPSRNTQNLVVRLKLIHIHHSTPSMHTWKTWSLMECFKGQSNKSFISSSMFVLPLGLWFFIHSIFSMGEIDIFM